MRVLAVCGIVWIVMMTVGARHGYHRGPVRQIAPAAAFAIAGFGAWLFGAELGHAALRETFMPWILRGVAGIILTGAVLWLVAYSALWRLGRNRANALDEVEHPVAGCIVGCWTGMFSCAALFLFVCAAGAVGQFWIETASPAPSFKRDAVQWPIAVKNSLARLRWCGWLRTWNPMPARMRRVIEKGVLVVGTPGALEHLRDLPSIRAIGTDPAFYPLTRDTEIRRLIAAGDIENLIAHPLVLQLLAVDDFQRRLADVDLEKLFDEALLATGKRAPAREEN